MVGGGRFLLSVVERTEGLKTEHGHFRVYLGNNSPCSPPPLLRPCHRPVVAVVGVTVSFTLPLTLPPLLAILRRYYDITERVCMYVCMCVFFIQYPGQTLDTKGQRHKE